jgi:sugar phosphate isomerase/epimerase
MTRRDMIKTTAAAAAVAGLCRTGARAATTASSTLGVSLQLYSVRKDCGQDFDKALAQVAEMGFDAVEFAGYHKYGGDPEGLAAKLDDLGLKVAGTHIGTGTLVGDALKKTVDFHQAIGCKYLIVPGDRRFSQPDGSKELAEIFNTAAEQLEEVGMKCGYHNHTHEFKKEGDKTYWELFAERTCDDVVLQQDVGWSTAAGQDAAALIRKYPGRSQIIHCKPAVVRGDSGRPIIGEDSVKWAEIIQACREAGGTEWLTVEQEAYLPGKSPMECVEMSLAGLKQILANGG